jgi:hypothetical protein
MPKSPSALFDAIQAELTKIDSRPSLWEAGAFVVRAGAIDHLEVHVVDRIAAIQSPSSALVALQQRADALLGRLIAVNEALFDRVRRSIGSGELRGERLRGELNRHRSPSAHGYDHLDGFVDGLLRLSNAVEPDLRSREPEMVFYQPTPARVVLELVAALAMRPGEVFYDLGSGLGQVCILVHLLTGVRARGVEVEPAYCDYALRSATRLNLSGLEIINADARDADCSEGTVFYMYTPFRGAMMERVLERLDAQTQGRAIRVCTYGGCRAQVSKQRWLRLVDQSGEGDDALAIFERGCHGE